MYEAHTEEAEEDLDIYDEEEYVVSDLESDISSPEWEPWDDKDDDSNDASQCENNLETQQHESEGLTLWFNCQLTSSVSRHGTAGTTNTS